jgi:hypothetical protein
MKLTEKENLLLRRALDAASSPAESEAAAKAFIRSLRERGVSGMILCHPTGKREHKPSQSRNQILNVHIGLIPNGCRQDGTDSLNRGNQRLLPHLRVDHSHHHLRHPRLNRKKSNLGELRRVHGRNTLIPSGISCGNDARHASRNPHRSNLHRLKAGHNVKSGSNALTLWAGFIPST